MKKNFALIGAAGYIAPRHMKAIKETGNELVAALDKSDNIGIIDSFFPEAAFFTEYERFDRHINKCRRDPRTKIDYVSICSPNYLHDAHIRFALKNDADAICEKPLVLEPHNIEQLKVIEEETGHKVNVVLQLRLHPSLVALKAQIEEELKRDPEHLYDIDLTYLTSRGKWYFFSWKGDVNKSGGVATNIGVHFFDMLSWLFGDVQENIVHIKSDDTCAGFLRFKNARVRWFLSVNANYIPDAVRQKGQGTYRDIILDGKEVEFSGGFTDLHTRCYEEVLKGNGFGLEDARASIEIVYAIRNMNPVGLKGEYHPFCTKVLQPE